MTSRQVRAPDRVPVARVIAVGVLLPFAAGCAAVLGFAPFYAWPVPLLSLAALFYAWRGSGSPLQGALSGFAWGLGAFGAGVSWVYVSMHRYGEMPALLAAAATFLFCAYLAIFPALAGWITARLTLPRTRARLAAAPALFMLGEWLRGWFLTGFPWLGLGTSQAPVSPLAGLAPYVGTYGITLALGGVAALALSFTLPDRGAPLRARAVAAAAAVALMIAGPLLALHHWTHPAGAPLRVALLQGNVPQDLKWEEAERTKTLLAYRAMIFATDARVAILPEAAVPAYLDQIPASYMASLRDHAHATGQEMLVGTPERERPPREGDDMRYYNSLVRIGADALSPAFRKHHLVPFGEFVPWGFRWFVNAMRIPMGDFNRGGARQPPLPAGGIRWGVAICYEDLFGEELVTQLPAAQAFAVVSNDGWFDDTLAAEQHLQASQMRALETGRWFVRATNTGATAAIDPSGQVVSQLPAKVAGTLVAEVIPMEGLTPYARVGNVPAVLIALAMLLVVRRRAFH